MATQPPFPLDRRRLGWWLVGAFVAAIVVLFLYSFVGTFVFGLFVYYGALPIFQHLTDALDSRDLAATVTLLFIVIPTLSIIAYAGYVAYTEIAATLGPDAVSLLLDRIPGNQQSVADALQSIPSTLQRVDQLSQVQEGLNAVLGPLAILSNVLLHFTLALTFAFFLYRDGDRVREWFTTEVGGRDTAAYSFVSGIDADLEVVYFGNVLTVISVAIAAILMYNGYNLIAPSAVALPFPTLLGLLTGLATFVPLVVGKLVYVPAAAFLGWQAARADGALLVYPLGFLVASFLVLDIVPQSIVRPYISGQSLHKGAVLFAYILGTALFGWYGLFLGPFFLVVVVQFANVILGDLLNGLPFSPQPTDAMTLGTDPEGARTETPDAASGAEAPYDADETPDATADATDETRPEPGDTGDDSPRDGDEHASDG
ncbi:AI-2E family transporter [Halorubellus sp. JP-L1]|uniref:AI-2E family transporter n=1 Tax=Halorubellus sp. JP-L1 TaxID=2715753 RepID=UPI00140A7790|nr:AI-2E family transporter [Halorubellus sp. JP-L1]NHN40349.1 AI-2E family transporter [Halorubellus sp. JP-L1]